MAYVDEKTKQLFLSFKPDELGIKKQTWLFSKRIDPKTKVAIGNMLSEINSFCKL